MERVRLQKTVEVRKGLHGASDDLIGVVSVREIMVAKGAAKTALAVKTSIAESGGHSNDRFVVDLVEIVDVHSSAKATLSKGFLKTRDENAFKKAVTQCVRVECSLREQRDLG